MGFRLEPSDLTLNGPEGSKIKVILFDVKYVKNGKSYDVGPKESLTCRTNRLSIGTVSFDLG